MKYYCVCHELVVIAEHFKICQRSARRPRWWRQHVPQDNSDIKIAVSENIKSFGVGTFFFFTSQRIVCTSWVFFFNLLYVDNAMAIKSWFQLLFETMLQRFLSPARRASTDTWSTWIPSQILFSDATSCHNVHVSQSFSFCSAMSKLSCLCRWSVMLSFGHRGNQGGCASSTLNGRVYTVTS